MSDQAFMACCLLPATVSLYHLYDPCIPNANQFHLLLPQCFYLDICNPHNFQSFNWSNFWQGITMFGHTKWSCHDFIDHFVNHFIVVAQIKSGSEPLEAGLWGRSKSSSWKVLWILSLWSKHLPTSSLIVMNSCHSCQSKLSSLCCYFKSHQLPSRY